MQVWRSTSTIPSARLNDAPVGQTSTHGGSAQCWHITGRLTLRWRGQIIGWGMALAVLGFVVASLYDGMGVPDMPARKRIMNKIDRGLHQVTQTTYLHTEPHHDDIMLAYLAHLYHLVRDATNVHHFANLTSGFTAVTNAYVFSVLKKLERLFGELSSLLGSGYFDPRNVTHRMADVYLYLDGIAGKDAPVEQREDVLLPLNVAVQCPGAEPRGLGDAAAWPVQGMLKHYRKEFEYHIEHKRCLV